MTLNASRIYNHIEGRGIKAMPRNLDLRSWEGRMADELKSIGINLKEGAIREAYLREKSSGIFADEGPIFPMGLNVPVQWLQKWAPGVIYAITSPLKSDELMGKTTIGEIFDDEIVYQTVERLGHAVPYTDESAVPYMTYNNSFSVRDIVRFEAGVNVTKLAEMRVAQVNLDDAAIKRASAAKALAIARHKVAMYGYAAGLNRTYGFLTDPEINNYETFPQGAGGSTLWENKTYLERTEDINTMAAQLALQTQGFLQPVDPSVNYTLAMGLKNFSQLAGTTNFGPSGSGISLKTFISTTYSSWRVLGLPELDAAHGGENVIYLFGERVEDASTDDGQVVMQGVPSDFYMLGTEQGVKGYTESYINATAGAVFKRPWAVTRWAGS